MIYFAVAQAIPLSHKRNGCWQRYSPNVTWWTSRRSRNLVSSTLLHIHATRQLAKSHRPIRLT